MVLIQYKISIIVPIFNAEKYLKRGLDSILNQTFDVNSLQVILVDDASSDNSRSIIEEYTNSYENFTSIFHDKNSGSAAEPRNSGLKIAKGDYVMFLDPDDEFRPEICEVLYDKIVESGVDLVKCNYVKVIGDSWEPYYYFDESVGEVSIKSSYVPLQHVTVCNGIHKMDVIRDNNLKFQNCIGEDFVFTLEEFLLIDEMIYLNNFFGYNYYMEEGSSHSTKPTVDKFYKTLDSFYLAYDLIVKYNRKDIVPSLFGYQILSLYFRYVNLDVSKKVKLELLRKIASLINLLDSPLETPGFVYSYANKLLSNNQISLAYYYFESFKRVKNLLG